MSKNLIYTQIFMSLYVKSMNRPHPLNFMRQNCAHGSTPPLSKNPGSAPDIWPLNAEISIILCRGQFKDPKVSEDDYFGELDESQNEDAPSRETRFVCDWCCS